MSIEYTAHTHTHILLVSVCELYFLYKYMVCSLFHGLCERKCGARIDACAILRLWQ